MENSNLPKKLPFFFVGKPITDKRKENFSTQKHPELCEKLGKEDTRNIWYSRDHITGLLDEIDHADGDGIRLHFGAYEEGHEFEGQLCLVMNVTRSSDGKQEDIVLENEPDYSQRSAGSRSIGDSTTKMPKDFNFGSPCPPRCDGNQADVPS